MGLTKISGGVIQSDNFSVGVITATSLQIGSATTIHTTGIDLGSGNITSHNINSTGIITATGVTVNGDLNVAGVLTYDDVTNIDSIGVVTARSGVHVTSGSVGIGTDNPSQELEVFGNAFTGIRIRSSRTGLTEQIGGVGFSTSSDQVATINALVDGTVIVKNTKSDTERLRITGIGSVGINENDPIHQLSVAIDSSTAWDSTKNISNTTNNDFIGLNIDNKNSGANPEVGIMLQAGASGSGQYTINCLRTGTNTGDLIFRTRDGGTASKEVLRINSVGRVGINSSLPASLVDIRGESAESAVVNIRSYDKSSAIKLWPSNAHDLDRWRMAFWENNSQTDGNNYPDWLVDGYGRQWMVNNLYIGRTKSFADSPTNQYRYYGTSGPGVFIYNGVDGDNTNYSAYINLRCYQSDTDDRNIIYYANAGTTNTLDYDEHQYFGVKANGRVQAKHQFFSGRVESDEGSPNSVYYAGRGGYYCYDSSSTAASYFLAEAGGSNSTYFAFARTSNNDTQWKHRTSDGRMYVDAGGTTFNGADYAEYFEWSDGNTNNEDRAGYTVVLKNGNKIGIATAGDSPSSIIGVISGSPAIVGDGQDLSWQGKWLKDEFGREITTDVQYLVWNRGYEKDENGNKVPVAQPNPNDQMSMQDSDQQIEVGSKLDTAIAEGDVPQFAIDNNIIMTGQRRVKNPDYNPDAIYVSREFRPEWSPVGLVGKLIVRKGQVMGERWIKMKDINEQLEQWLVR